MKDKNKTVNQKAITAFFFVLFCFLNKSTWINYHFPPSSSWFLEFQVKSQNLSSFFFRNLGCKGILILACQSPQWSSLKVTAVAKKEWKIEHLRQICDKKDNVVSLKSWQALCQQLRCFSIITFVYLQNGSVSALWSSCQQTAGTKRGGKKDASVHVESIFLFTLKCGSAVWDNGTTLSFRPKTFNIPLRSATAVWLNRRRLD